MIFYDESGFCFPDKPPGAQIDYNNHIAQTKQLKVSATEIKDLIDKKIGPANFPTSYI